MLIPEGMPVLSGGAHGGPQEGACFMEYVSVLAGEPWSDNPKCVETGLATVMQTINDFATDDTRHLLVPLLGRGIGLAPAPYPDLPFFTEWNTLPASKQNVLQAEHMREKARYEEESLVLRRAAWLRFAEKIEGCACSSCLDMDKVNEDPSSYFSVMCTEAMNRKFIPQHRGCAEAIAFMVEWATKLHEAYEDAMKEFGWSRKVYTQKCSTEDVMTLLTYPEMFDGERRLFAII